MVVISGVLGEAELEVMPDELVTKLGRLLNRYIAKCLIDYRNNPEARKDLVEKVNRCIGQTLDEIAMNDEIEKLDIFNTIFGLAGCELGDYTTDKQLYEKLSKADELLSKCKPMLPIRQNSDFQDFDEKYKTVINLCGSNTTYPNMLQVYQANKQVLYSKSEKQTYYASNTLLTYRSSWYGFKRGLDYYDYCEKNNIRYSERFKL